MPTSNGMGRVRNEYHTKSSLGGRNAASSWSIEKTGPSVRASWRHKYQSFSHISGCYRSLLPQDKRDCFITAFHALGAIMLLQNTAL